METQNITGVDVIPKGFSVNHNTENNKEVQQQETENKPRPEENKGNNIDVKV